MRRPEQDPPRSRTLEPSGKGVLFFLSLPLVFLALLFFSLAGCGDSGGRAGNGSGTVGKATTPAKSSTSTSSSTSSGTRSVVPTTGTTTDGRTPRTAGVTPPAPPSGPVSWATADSAYGEGSYDDAVTLFSAYVEEHPSNPWGHYMVGLSSWKAGDLQGAEKALRRTTDLDPAHGKAWVNLARVLIEEDRPGEARIAVNHALELEPDWNEGLRVLGRVAEADGATDEAETAYRRAILSDSDDAWSMNNLGLLRVRAGDYDGAVGPLARAVQIRDDVAVFQNNLGVALERTGRFAAAREAYQKADSVAGGYEKARVSLTRLDGVAGEPGTEPVELASLADGFRRTVESWRREQMAEASTSPAGATPTPETDSAESGSVRTPEPETAPPETSHGERTPEAGGDSEHTGSASATGGGEAGSIGDALPPQS